MSLIFAINLARKIIIVTDTRLTVKVNDIESYEDDLIKVVLLNTNVSVATAGSVGLAVYAINKIKNMVNKDHSIQDVEDIVREKIDDIVKSYVNEGNKFPVDTVLLFAGFDPNTRKKINSTYLGKVLSSEAAKKEGELVYPAIKREIIDSLSSEVIKRGSLPKDSIIEIGPPNSYIFSCTISVKNNSYKIKYDKGETFEYLIYHPEMAVETIKIPDEIINKLEFTQESVDQYNNKIISNSLLQSETKKRNFPTVGGNLFFIILEPDVGWIIPTGGMFSISQNNKIEHHGTVKVIDGRFCYILPNGNEGVYRMLGTSIFGDMDIV